MGLTPEQRVMRARLAAFAMHAKHDPKKTTTKARETFLSNFEHDVDPDGVLPEKERKRRAESARKAYFARLAFSSSKARTKKKESVLHGS